MFNTPSTSVLGLNFRTSTECPNPLFASVTRNCTLSKAEPMSFHSVLKLFQTARVFSISGSDSGVEYGVFRHPKMWILMFFGYIRREDSA